MEEESKKYLWWGIPIVVVAGLAAVLWFGRRHNEEPAATQQVQAEPVAPAAGEPADHPIEAPAAQEPLPALGDSDGPLQGSLAEVFGRQLEQFLVPKDIIRHIVVTVDNLPRKKTAVQMWPLHPTGGVPIVDGQFETLTLSDQNTARYAPIMALVRNTDARQAAALYKRYYPLFQQAYTELGYPDGYFNNRLVEVIDHLLQTPDVTGPIKLTQPGVFYEYADPTLEERSAGQKLLIRMGSDNAATLKMKLRELRREVAKRE